MKGQANTRRVLKLGGPILALRYLRAANRDENSGFAFSAAMEWRKAAELSSSIPLLADRYWREWERVMHLPRRLAEPIGVAHAVKIGVRQRSLPLEVDLAVHPTVRTKSCSNPRHNNSGVPRGINTSRREYFPSRLVLLQRVASDRSGFLARAPNPNRGSGTMKNVIFKFLAAFAVMCASLQAQVAGVSHETSGWWPTLSG